MSPSKWLFFPSPAVATEKLIATVGAWQAYSSPPLNVSINSTVVSGPYGQVLRTSTGTAVQLSRVVTSAGSSIIFNTIAQNTAFQYANSGAQGWMLRHRGHNGTTSDPAKYYLGVGEWINTNWTGQMANMDVTTRWLGTIPSGIYMSTNPTDMLLLDTIGLQMAATVTSIQGTPTSAAYTGAMGTTTTGSLPTGLASVQHRGGYGLRFIFGSEAQRNTFVGNYPSGVGTWYSGVGDSLAFTKSGWAWNLSVSSSSADIQSPPSNSSNFELWHANGVYAVGDDVQLIHTA